MGILITITKDELNNNKFLYKCIQDDLLERVDVTREEVLSKLPKYFTDLSNEHLRIRTSFLPYEEKSKLLDVVYNELKKQGYYKKYERVLNSIPINFDKVKSYLKMQNQINDNEFYIFKTSSQDFYEELMLKLEKIRQDLSRE